MGVPPGQATVRRIRWLSADGGTGRGQTVLPEVVGPALDQEFSVSGAQREQEGVCRRVLRPVFPKLFASLQGGGEVGSSF